MGCVANLSELCCDLTGPDLPLVVCSLCLLFAQVFVGILRCYAVVLAFFVAIAETEWERIFKFWKVSAPHPHFYLAWPGL